MISELSSTDENNVVESAEQTDSKSQVQLLLDSNVEGETKEVDQGMDKNDLNFFSEFGGRLKNYIWYNLVVNSIFLYLCRN